MGIREDILTAAILLYAGSNPSNALESVVDDSGNGTGTREPDAATGPQWVRNATLGRYGLAFNGANHIDALNDAIFDFAKTDPFSIAVWIKSSTATITGAQAILAKQQNVSPFRGFSLFIRGDQPGDPFELELISTVLTDGLLVRFPRPADTGLHHILTTHDGTGKAAGIRAYVDGVSQTLTVVQDTLVGSISTTASLQVGARQGGSDFTGFAADTLIANRVLTPAEAAWLADPANMLITQTDGSLRLPTRISSRLSLRL